MNRMFLALILLSTIGVSAGAKNPASNETSAKSAAQKYDYGYYDNYDGGYFIDGKYHDDWFYDFYDGTGEDYDYYSSDWHDWEEDGLFN